MIRLGWRRKENVMTTVLIDLPDDVYGALRTSPQEFSREICIAAAVHWYSQGRLSQGKGAEIAGLSRSEFIDELYRRRTPAVQVTGEEVIGEALGG